MSDGVGRPLRSTEPPARLGSGCNSPLSREPRPPRHAGRHPPRVLAPEYPPANRCTSIRRRPSSKRPLTPDGDTSRRGKLRRTPGFMLIGAGESLATAPSRNRRPPTSIADPPHPSPSLCRCPGSACRSRPTLATLDVIAAAPPHCPRTVRCRRAAVGQSARYLGGSREAIKCRISSTSHSVSSSQSPASPSAGARTHARRASTSAIQATLC